MQAALDRQKRRSWSQAFQESTAETGLETAKACIIMRSLCEQHGSQTFALCEQSLGRNRLG